MWPQGAEELFVMANEAKILLPNERVASVYCRIYYELDFQTVVRSCYKLAKILSNATGNR